VKRRLTLLTEIIAPYRIPVFNALACDSEIDLHVIFLAETDPSMRQWKIYKEDIRFSYEVLPSWRWIIGKSNLLINRGLGNSLLHASPDVLLCGGYNYIASWQAMYWARRRQKPFLLWMESNERDYRYSSFIVRKLKASFLRRCAAAVVPGKASSEYATKLGFPPERVFIAPNAVDNELFARAAEQARANSNSLRRQKQLPSRFFLFVGRLVREKGVFDLLDAYGKLSPDLRKQVGLVYVGNGNARGELERRGANITPGTVQIAGFADREQLGSYYGLAEAFVFPTYTDPWGLVVNEAMACGLPIIASSVAGAVDDLVQDHWNGVVVSQKDPAQLAQAMDQLARHPEMRWQMGQNSLSKIREYSPQACASGIANAARIGGG
jgi:glycosyltransferase involved in cell wall biosynthesis